MKLDKYISIILVSVVILMLVGFWYNYRLNEQLKEAEAETQSAISELQRVKGVSSFYKSELKKVTADMDRRIADADKQIASLTDQVNVRKSLIDKLRAENERLNSAILATINLPVEDPLPPDELLKETEQLYFPRTFEDSASVLFPADLVQTMLREIEQRRELDFSNIQIITEQGKQIKNLGQIISEHESKYLSLEEKFNCQGLLVSSLNDEIVHYDSVVAGLNKQIKILNKPRFWTSWQGQAVAVAALMGGVYIGSKL